MVHAYQDDPIRDLPLGQRSADYWWTNFLMAAYGAGWCFTIPIVGHLYAAELIAVVCLPFLGWRTTIARYRDLRLVLAGYGLILVGLVLADLIHHTATRDFLRGWANPIFAATALVFVVSILRRNAHAFLYFLLATFLFKLALGDAGYTLRYGQAPLSISEVLRDTNVFKTRFLPFVIPAVMLLAFYLARFGSVWSAMVYLGTAVCCIVLDARAGALALLAAGGFLLLRQVGFRITPRGIALLAVPALLGGQLLYMAYVNYSLAYNPNGHTSTQLRKLENPYNPLRLLIQGRSDWLVADSIIADDPAIGHGSWTRDPDRKYFSIMKERSSDSTDMYVLPDGTALAPTHSFLLTSWIWAGLLGFIGALCVLWAALKVTIRAVQVPQALSVVAALSAAFLLWDLLFSPIQVIRVSFPHYLGLLIVLGNLPLPWEVRPSPTPAHAHTGTPDTAEETLS